MDEFVAAIALFCVLVVVYTVHTLCCRVLAEKCPLCGSTWQTRCGEAWRNGSAWTCHSCGHRWIVREREES